MSGVEKDDCDCGRDERRYIIHENGVERVVCKLCFQSHEHGVKHGQPGSDESQRRVVGTDRPG